MIKLKSLISESITFQDIIDFFRPLKPGSLVIREHTLTHGHLYMLVETPSKDDKFVRVMHVGNIGHNISRQKYASFIFNTKDAGIMGIRQNAPKFESFRRLKSDEIKLVKDALKEPRHDRYLDIIKNKTGLNPKV
jgi:hypothetical protein